MCGIAGLFDTTGRQRDRDFAGTAQAMADAMPHRGPDARDGAGDIRRNVRRSGRLLDEPDSKGVRHDGKGRH